MGYYIWQADAEFTILREKHDEALAAVKAATTHDFGWVGMDDVQRSTTLVEALDAWRWATSLSEAGDIVEIAFRGEKLSGDDGVLWDAIAPFVEDGSYIEMVGEQGERWRWKFNGGAWTEVSARLVWDE